MGVSSILTSGMGVYQAIQGKKEQKDAQKALENYNRQELKNVAENLQVSTLGADLKREEQARLASTQIDALQGGGTRALVGGLGRVQAGNQAVNAEIVANLDEQQKNIDAMKAEDNARIRSMKENREIGDIDALSSQYQSGKNDFMMGIGTAIQGIGSLENKFGEALGAATGVPISSGKAENPAVTQQSLNKTNAPMYGTRNKKYGAIGS